MPFGLLDFIVTEDPLVIDHMATIRGSKFYGKDEYSKTVEDTHPNMLNFTDSPHFME